MFRIITIGLVVGCMLLLLPVWGIASEPAATLSPRDRALLEPSASAQPSEAEQKSQRQGKPDWAARLERELGAAADSEDDPTWLRAVRCMQRAGGALRAGRPEEALAEQQRAVALWEELLLSAANQGAASGSAPAGSAGSAQSGTHSAQIAQGAEAGGRPVEQPAMGRAEGPSPNNSAEPLAGVLVRLWGELPERIREQVRQWPSEDFVPKYEALTEWYFRQLAEGNPKP